MYKLVCISIILYELLPFQTEYHKHIKLSTYVICQCSDFYVYVLCNLFYIFNRSFSSGS